MQMHRTFQKALSTVTSTFCTQNSMAESRKGISGNQLLRPGRSQGKSRARVATGASPEVPHPHGLPHPAWL